MRHLQRLAVALCLLTPRAGLADGRRAQALALKERAAAAFRQSDYVGALQDLEEAYRIYPSPNLRYNLGLALSRLGREEEAVGQLERFLAEAKGARADARGFAEAELAAARRRLAVAAPAPGATAPALPITLPPEPRPAATALDVTVRAVSPAAPRPTQRHRWVAWLLGGVGLASLGAGTGLFASSKSLAGALTPGCCAVDDPRIADGRTQETAALALFAVTGVLLAADVAFLVADHALHGRRHAGGEP